MKKICSVLLAGCALAMVLAACGGTADSPSQPPPSSAPVSTPGSASVPGSVPPPASGSTAGEDVSALAAQLAEAADLGATIDMIELDLTAGGIDIANVDSFAGLQSQSVAQNGGMVLVIAAKEGTAAEVAAQLEGYREVAMGNQDYAEFEAARANIAEARINTYGNTVVYATSASGDWAKLDAGLASAFGA